MDSCPSKIPRRGGSHFGGCIRIAGKPAVIADLRGVFPRGIARVSESGIFVAVYLETHAVCKRLSPFENGLKSEPIYKRPRQYENREDIRLQQYESRLTRLTLSLLVWINNKGLANFALMSSGKLSLVYESQSRNTSILMHAAVLFHDLKLFKRRSDL